MGGRPNPSSPNHRRRAGAGDSASAVVVHCVDSRLLSYSLRFVVDSSDIGKHTMCIVLHGCGREITSAFSQFVGSWESIRYAERCADLDRGATRTGHRLNRLGLSGRRRRHSHRNGANRSCAGRRWAPPVSTRFAMLSHAPPSTEAREKNSRLNLRSERSRSG